MNIEMTSSHEFSIGQCATLACLLEATAPKPGNVHRGADFEDVTFIDFAASAVAIGPVIDAASSLSFGELVYRAINATRNVTQSNTNLGLVLLIVPLAKAAMQAKDGCFLISRESVQTVLSGLSAQDSALVYDAIRLANPGGMGSSDRHDINSSAPSNLIEAMNQSSDRDMIARQYAHGFVELFENIVPWLIESRSKMERLTDAIVWTHVRTMAEFPDSLIGRKCGRETAHTSAALAQKAVASSAKNPQDYLDDLNSLDFWLRSDHHQRNPGTTADLIGAALFIAIIEGKIRPPLT